MSPSKLLPLLLLLSIVESIVALHLKTKQGTLDGEESESRSGKTFYTFNNIPFAKPPVGELRFEPPQDPEPWDGVRDATMPSNPCVQTPKFIFSAPADSGNIGQEDCLYLNVFTPDGAGERNLSWGDVFAVSKEQSAEEKFLYRTILDLFDQTNDFWTLFSNTQFNPVKPKTLMPVLVFIYGGAYAAGIAFLYGPQYFMDYPVVVVTIQYRLGVLGFLSTIDEVIPGNYGMKDQVAALKWIQKNIDAFGGDPKRVTVSGESNGGANVHSHMYSPLSKGLFHQGISESGTRLAFWTVIRPDMTKKLTYTFATMVGCSQSDSKALLKCLRTVPADQIAVAHDELYVSGLTPIVLFGPVIEPKSVKNAYLSENPWRQNVTNRGGVPWIVGLNEADGNVVTNRVLSTEASLEEWNRDFNRMVSMTLHYTYRENASAISNAIKKSYLNNKDITPQIWKNFSDIFRDSMFLTDILEAASRHDNKVFLYLFDHRFIYSADTVYGNFSDETSGPSHGDELIALYQLDALFPPLTDEEPKDYAVSRKMCDYWMNFVQTGDPNGNGKKIWQPFSKETFDYLHIMTESDVMEKNLFRDRYKFWMNLLYSSPDHQISSGKG